MIAARCGWFVTAGLVPGELDPTFSRQWSMSSREWDDDQRSVVAPGSSFFEKEGLASGYARSLQALAVSGGAVNWVRLEFFWY